ncbi:hypothetical protein POV27_17820 [Aureisphaera galaxeae]|uniref:hypothetical protein n=1 Tax=Aureisphaera galaxeae TaxID=1538023 RepID=UPI00235034DB|nr:hypothetical protein [Aureisphaera galaxeae]MDC8005916.1 hypothetical protein [Aureisphaera galaxeae]
MDRFLRLGAYVLHPLLMPILGTAIYFYITPRYIDREIIQSKLLAIFIITFLIPVVTYFLLKNIGLIQTSQLEDVRERKFPLMIQCLLILLVVKMVFDPYDTPEMYYFYVGILFSSISALILVLFKIKVSLHQMGVAGLTMFVIALSIHFQINMLIWIGLLLFGNGWVASSRLSTYSHTVPELVLGFFVGVVPQLLMLQFWL